MSGIVGIINVDGAPVDRERLHEMTTLMAFRGPDAESIWTNGNVGLGHAMLLTDGDASNEQQPLTLDDNVWITADARIDARAELIQKLNAHDKSELEAASDAQLILRAYQVWKEDCVHHLIGDFAFAIWDAGEKRLFCARDQFGLKPFYYAQVARSLIFSNTLNVVRAHPSVSDNLNEQAIGDFLLFDFNRDPSTTFFRDIKRLPPAHYLSNASGELALRRYWSLPTQGEIRYRASSEYVEHFREVLKDAVGDRLRERRATVLMSGGMDSTTVAAAAQSFLSEKSEPTGLRALTWVYDQLLPDRERHYAGLVAEALRLPIDYLVTDEYKLYERFRHLHTPEPLFEPLAAMSHDAFGHAAAHSRVALSGVGVDPLLFFPARPHLASLVKGGRLTRAIADTARYMVSHRHSTRINLRKRAEEYIGKNGWRPTFPAWLNQDFVTRMNLRERWMEMNKRHALVHTVRPAAYRMMSEPVWAHHFERQDAGVTGFPLEIRYPFFDIRILNYVWAIPPVPWCMNKRLLREAMRGLLPAPVLRRPKTPLAGDPIMTRLQVREEPHVMYLDPAPGLQKYVDVSALPRRNDPDHLEHAWMNLRPLALNYWLQNSKLSL